MSLEGILNIHITKAYFVSLLLEMYLIAIHQFVSVSK